MNRKEMKEATSRAMRTLLASDLTRAMAEQGVPTEEILVDHPSALITRVRVAGDADRPDQTFLLQMTEQVAAARMPKN